MMDALLRHHVYLQRLGSGVVNRIIAILNRSDKELAQLVAARLALIEGNGFDAGPATTARLEAIIDEVRRVNRAAYDQIERELTPQLREIAEYEAEWSAEFLGSRAGPAWNAMSPQTAASAALARPFQGRLLSEILDGLEAAQAARVRDAIRLGVVEGETVGQIVRRIRGTRSANYADGLLDIGRRAAETVVRTAVNHVSNHAREALYAENADIVSEREWVASLDSRTCAVCGALDGKRFPLDKGPRPPRHFSCRCTTVPVIADAFLQGFLDAEDRASKDGPVSAKTDYGTWLKRQSAEFQDDTLGPTRGALFRRGGLKLDKFSNRRGDELTIAELRDREPGAFRRAGL